MSDFDPAVRNAAWWASDTRRAASGYANEVILQKQGKMPIPDLSNIEAVQMGHVMEPVIGRLAQDKLRVELTKIEEYRTHPKHEWFRAHFDFAGRENGEPILVECKNYNAAVRSKFDESGVMPAADMAQLVHEAAVMGVKKIYLAVLFGGQEFVLIPKLVEEAEKDELIQKMAVLWGHVQSGTQADAETTDQCKAMWPVSMAISKVATSAMEELCDRLVRVKHEMKQLEEMEEVLKTNLQKYMGEADTLGTFDGKVLATWKSSKPTTKFNTELFKAAMPEVYKQFMVEVPGSRRFLIK
jgi:predicted phage-related endonuclease